MNFSTWDLRGRLLQRFVLALGTVWIGACSGPSTPEMNEGATALPGAEAGALEPGDSTGDLTIISPCKEGQVSGKCMGEDRLLEAAVNQCHASGLVLKKWAFGAPCARGFESISFLCCPGDLTCCRADGVATMTPIGQCKRPLPPTACQPDEPICCKTENGPQILPGSQCPQYSELEPKFCEGPCVAVASNQGCLSAEDWKGAVIQKCEAQGLELTSYTLGPACGPNKFTSIQATCCPVADVCCELSTGPALVPANQCDRPLPADQCKPFDVCCKTPSGYQVTPNASCPADWTLPLAECEATVCCKTDAGFAELPATQCPSSQVAPGDYCKPQDVCCKTTTGLQIVLEDQCPIAAIVGFDMCLAEVCCKTDAGPVTVPAVKCPALQQLPADLCNAGLTMAKHSCWLLPGPGLASRTTSLRSSNSRRTSSSSSKRHSLLTAGSTSTC